MSFDSTMNKLLPTLAHVRHRWQGDPASAESVTPRANKASGSDRRSAPIRRPCGVRESEDKQEAGHRDKEKFVHAEPSIHTSL